MNIPLKLRVPTDLFAAILSLEIHLCKSKITSSLSLAHPLESGCQRQRLLAKRGAKVALLARSKEALEELSARLPGSLPIVRD
jgi:hypothetical protein